MLEEWSVKRRIFVYHTLTVLAALVTLLVVSGGVMGWVTHRYQEWSRSAIDDRAEQVQALLSGSSGTDWGRLDAQLRELGYHLRVGQNGRELYSSLDPFQEDAYQRFSADAVWPPNGTHTIQNDGILMIGTQNGPYTIVAMSRPHIPEVFGRQRPQSEAVMLSLITSGLTAIVLIVLLSLLFTNHQVKQLMRPVNALADAAQRVERGDLSRPVDYHGKDEFASVCAAFDHMQRHLLAEREKNAAYEQARTDLVAGISHDLRTPLTSVKGYIKGLRDGVANTPETQRQYLDVASRKACDMDILLQRLFYFSKMETGNLPLFPERADLGSFVRRFAEDVQGELEAKGGHILVQGAPTPHPVRIDTEQIYRVLTNLTDNALRYAGTTPLELTLTIWRERDTERLRFADNGAGVPEEQLSHLFEQFWRGDQARGSRGGEGSGLGLYIVKYIVEAHGGTVAARNDHGLVFEIALPCEEEV